MSYHHILITTTRLVSNYQNNCKTTREQIQNKVSKTDFQLYIYKLLVFIKKVAKSKDDDGGAGDRSVHDGVTGCYVSSGMYGCEVDSVCDIV